MVGPDSEQTATVRHTSRMFVTAATLTVPFLCVIVRRAFGLGAQAMAGGSLHAPAITHRNGTVRVAAVTNMREVWRTVAVCSESGPTMKPGA